MEITPNLSDGAGEGSFDGTCKEFVPTTQAEIDAKMGLYILVICLSLFGNTTVIFTVFRNRRMHTVTNYLISNMAVADLLITLVPMVWEVLDLRLFKGEWKLGAFMCTFTYMCIYLSVASTVLSMMVIAGDRFLAIMIPLKKFITSPILVQLIFIIWIFSVAFASPTIMAQKIVVEDGKKYCYEIWSAPFDAEKSPKIYTLVLFVGLYVFPLVTMGILYGIIANKLWKHRAPGEQTSQAELNNLRQKRKVIKMLVTIVVVFMICWFPVYLVQFLYYFSSHYLRCPDDMPKWLIFTAFLFQYLNSCLNPYIYFFFSQSFRKGFFFAFRCIFPTWRRISPTRSMTADTGMKRLGRRRQQSILTRQESAKEKKTDKCNKSLIS